MAEVEQGEIVLVINVDGQAKIVQTSPQMALNSSDPMVRHEAYGIVARTADILDNQSATLSSSSSSLSTPVPEPASCQDPELSDIDEGNSYSLRETEQKTYSFWSREATQLLIHLYQDNQDDLKNPRKQKKDIWARITDIMNKEGYNFTQNKVECKWRSLLQSHKNVRDNKNQTGQKRKSFQYYQEMDSIVSKRHDINPPYTAGSGSRPSEGKRVNFSTKEGPKTGTSAGKGKNGRKGKETKNSDELLEYLKTLEQRRKEEVEEHKKKRDERAKEQNDLLRKLVDKF